MELNFTEFGGENISRGSVVILHGLFGSARNWTSIAKSLAEICRVITVDMPNHGESPWLEPVDYVLMAGAVSDFLELHGLNGSAIMGHSMGGKTAMVLTLLNPTLIDRLIVVDIAPVGYDHDNECYINAMEMVDLASLQSRKDADAQLTRHVKDASLRAFLLLNLVHSDDRFTWRINLKGLKAGLMTLHGFPDVLKEMIFEGQVMFLGGETSDYIRAAYEPAIRGYFPNAQIVKIKGAAHWLHADKPDEFIKVVRNFLS